MLFGCEDTRACYLIVGKQEHAILSYGCKGMLSDCEGAFGMLSYCEGAMACYLIVRMQGHAICYCEGAMACYMLL